MRYLFIFFLLLCSAWSLAEDRANTGVLAIVIPANQTVNSLKLTPEKLQLIYLRKQLYWPNGKRIQPVNLRSDHHLRQQFSQAILGNLPKAQIDYWNGQYFNGVLPPHTVNSEEAVIRYVAQTNGAIGYVQACLVDDRVNAAVWVMPNGNVLTNKPTLNCTE